MRRAGHHTVGTKPVKFTCRRHLCDEGTRDDGRVDVDSRKVDEAAIARSIDFSARRRAAFWPPGFIPSMPEEWCPPCRARSGFNECECLGERIGPGEVKSSEREPGARRVHVGINEAGRDDCPV